MVGLLISKKQNKLSFKNISGERKLADISHVYEFREIFKEILKSKYVFDIFNLMRQLCIQQFA